MLMHTTAEWDLSGDAKLEATNPTAPPPPPSK